MCYEKKLKIGITVYSQAKKSIVKKSIIKKLKLASSTLVDF